MAEATAAAPAAPAPPRAAVEGMLNKWMKVELTDGRVVQGRFIALDSYGTLLLRDTELCGDGAGPAGRAYGCVSIAKALVTKVQLQQ